MGALRAVSALRANGEEFPVEASISQVAVGGAKLATVVMRDITEREAGERARQLLAQEVDHRAKNALAVVQAVVSLTQAPTKEAFIEAVRGRIAALARAHSLLAENRWEGSDLFRIIAEETAPYGKPGQVSIEGVSVTMTADAVQPVSLIINELAANALKYGALSLESGRVTVTATLSPTRELLLRWVESGGPKVEMPTATGFGTTLLTQIASRQLRSRIEIEWLADGLQVLATLPPRAYHGAPVGDGGSPVAPGRTERKDLPAGKVLVVEDELLIALELCQGLEREGWKVVGPATSVEEAMAIIDRHADIDVAILDINLGGQLAYPIADRLRASGVPYVFCSGYEKPEDSERRAGDRIVRKPVNIRLLAEQLGLLGAA
jgi:two-component sensor histidine kinase/CheY-like chemotaxis protein